MNRYSMIALILIAVMILFISFDIDDDDIEITGYADDMHVKENGTTFTIVDAEGNHIKAFSSSEIDGSLHIFKGNYSKDGNIFFVNVID